MGGVSVNRRSLLLSIVASPFLSSRRDASPALTWNANALSRQSVDEMRRVVARSIEQAYGLRHGILTISEARAAK